jgi:hypothetical protein
MFPWQVFGLCRLNPTRRTSQCLSAPVSSWLSYLLTAAGQFRILTGFPLILLAEKPWKEPPYLVLLFSASTLGVDILLKRSP